VQAAEKKLFITRDGHREIVHYDFSFALDDETHFMCFAKDDVYVINVHNTRVLKFKIKLDDKDQLMTIEHGNYDYTPVPQCRVRTAWLDAYVGWIAEKEIFDV
jgi:hypothetical protein